MSPGSRPIQGTRPTSTSTRPTRAIKRPKPMRSLPRSFTVAGAWRAFEEPLLAGCRGGRLLAQMPVGFPGDPPPVGRAHDEAALQDVGFDHLGQSPRHDVHGAGD